MSTELMKSKFFRFVCPSSVSVAVITVLNARTSFKFYLLLTVGYALGLIFLILEKKKNNTFCNFLGVFFFFSFSLIWEQ